MTFLCLLKEHLRWDVEKSVARLITHHCSLQGPRAGTFILMCKTEPNEERATEQCTRNLAKMALPGSRQRS